MNTEKKTLELKVATLEDTGTFTGLLSVYGNVDDGGDVVLPGAYTKTLQESRVVQMLWQHKQDEPIGVFALSDSPDGIAVEGKLNLDDAVPTAKRVHSMMKFLKAHGLSMGMSIGFQAIKKEMKDGVRYLKEIRLLEGSLVTVPMNAFCRVTDVKSLDGEAKDFLSSLDAIQLYASKYHLIQALGESLETVLYGGETSAEQKNSEAALAIDQFRDTYMEWLPKMQTLWGAKEFPAIEAKAGRTISAASRKRIEEAITSLQALIHDAMGTSEEAANDAIEGAANPNTAEPGDALHSVTDLIREFRLTEAA